MKAPHVIPISIVIVIAALSTGCGKKPGAVTPQIVIDADRGTNATMVSTNGYTFMVGKFTVGTNADQPNPKP